jgi:hypothetical protein
MTRGGAPAAALLALAAFGCGDDTRVRSGIVPTGDDPSGAAGEPGVGGAGGDTGMTTGTAGAPGPAPILTAAGFAKAPHCEDIFAPVLQTFSIDISPNDWNAMHAEYVAVALGTPGDLENHNSTRYPIVFHFGAEAKPATIRLKGESSWQSSYLLDGDNGKMQFAVSFDDDDQDAKFHGIGGLALDMPPNDPTFLRSRIANAWLRSVGIPAFCSTSARLFVNGDYYGLFSAEERAGGHYVREFFPGNAMGDLVKSGWKYETNESMPNRARLHQFWDADSPGQLTAALDVPSSLKSWAAEAILNDGDGYWGGGHNFLIYDQGAAGWVFLPYDLDASLEYLHYFNADPIFWWSTRGYVGSVGDHYKVVIDDPNLRAQLVEAVATATAVFDPATLQGWYDEWSAQIRDAVIADPHRPSMTGVDDFDDAVALGRGGMAKRAEFLRSWVACKHDGSGADADHDGFRFCEDCRDDNASINPGAGEVCGNGKDDNCNGRFDEGCPPPPPPPDPTPPPVDPTVPPPPA